MNTRPQRRPYRQVARAEAAEATRERILDAALEEYSQLPWVQVTLDGVARRADVAVQTVIRRFGGKEGLFVALAARERERVSRRRDQAQPGDTAAALTLLVDHYESDGDVTLKLLAEEAQVPPLREVLDYGRTYHREWCARVFASALEGHTGVDRRRRLAQLVSICDVYTWKLLRRDAGLSRRQTELAIRELLEPMLKDR